MEKKLEPRGAQWTRIEFNGSTIQLVNKPYCYSAGLASSGSNPSDSLFFPSIYLYGVTSESEKNYIVGTFIGLWPLADFNAYVGTLAADIFSIGTADAPTVKAWLLSIVLLAALLLIIQFIISKQKVAYSNWTNEK